MGHLASRTLTRFAEGLGTKLVLLVTFSVPSLVMHSVFVWNPDWLPLIILRELKMILVTAAVGVAGRGGVACFLSYVQVNINPRRSRSTVAVKRCLSELSHLDDWPSDGVA